MKTGKFWQTSKMVRIKTYHYQLQKKLQPPHKILWNHFLCHSSFLLPQVKQNQILSLQTDCTSYLNSCQKKNHEIECTHTLVPSLPCRNTNLEIISENSIKSAIRLPMKDGIHFSNLYISLKVFCEGLQDPPIISKFT